MMDFILLGIIDFPLATQTLWRSYCIIGDGIEFLHEKMVYDVKSCDYALQSICDWWEKSENNGECSQWLTLTPEPLEYKIKLRIM